MLNISGSLGSLLTSSLTKVIQHAFDEADDDGDGLLSETEFETFVSNIPTDIVELSTTDTAAAFAGADADDDGRLSFEEVADATVAAVDASDAVIDTTRSSSIAKLLSTLSGDTATTGTVFSYLDTDKDGAVSITEIIAMYSKNASKMYSILQQSSIVTGDSLDVSA